MRAAAVRMNESRKRLRVRVLLVLLLVSPASFGSLVITIYHNEAIYIGSDSMATSMATGKQVDSVQKIFQFSTNACAAITGFAMLKVGGLPGKPEYSLNVAKALERLCERELPKSDSVERKITLIAEDLNLRCKVFFDDPAIKLPGALESERTRIQFAGYDPEKRRFFQKSLVLGAGEELQFDVAQEFGEKKGEVVSLQGEARFLKDLISRKDRVLWRLVSPEFARTADKLAGSTIVPAHLVKDYMLELFYLHRRYAANLSEDKGLIAPPYRVFKITKNKVTQLTDDPPTSRIQRKVN